MHKIGCVNYARFPNPVTYLASMCKKFNRQYKFTSLQVGSIKKIMKYTMKIYGEVNTSVEGKHHIFCFLNST